MASPPSIVFRMNWDHEPLSSSALSNHRPMILPLPAGEGRGWGRIVQINLRYMEMAIRGTCQTETRFNVLTFQRFTFPN
jgi:hypothetical protein